MKISWRSPKGRINRKSYFLRNLIMGGWVVILSLIILTLAAFGKKENCWPLLSLAGICSIPLIYVFFWLYPVNIVKRLHDLNLSGWFVFLLYVCSIFSKSYPVMSIIGLIFSLFLLFKKGTTGPNKYGAAPLVEENINAVACSQFESNQTADDFNSDHSLNSMDSSFDSPETMYRSANVLMPKKSASNIQDDKLLNLLLKVMVGLIVAVVVVLGISYYIKSNQPAYKEVVYKNSDIKVKYLTGDMLQFLKANYPQDSKRLVVYLPEFENATCPYMQDFVQGLRQVKSNPQWTNTYHFMPAVNSVYAESRSEADKKMDKIQNFIEKVCGNMCIVDTQENWVFEIKRGDLIPIALEEFKK